MLLNRNAKTDMQEDTEQEGLNERRVYQLQRSKHSL